MATKKRAVSLPPAADGLYEEIGRQVEAVASGALSAWGFRDFQEAMATLYLAASSARPDNQHDESRVVSFSEIVAERVRQARTDAGWTQEQLADAMSQAGHDWKRVTVAEVETQGRRVSLEELLTLAVLFGVPMLHFLLVGESDAVQLPESSRCYRTIGDLSANELILGKGGRMGSGGADWEEARRIAAGPTDDDSWRPARAMWARRVWMPPVEAGTVTGPNADDVRTFMAQIEVTERSQRTEGDQ